MFGQLEGNADNFIKLSGFVDVISHFSDTVAYFVPLILQPTFKDDGFDYLAQGKYSLELSQILPAAC